MILAASIPAQPAVGPSTAGPRAVIRRSRLSSWRIWLPGAICREERWAAGAADSHPEPGQPLSSAWGSPAGLHHLLTLNKCLGPLLLPPEQVFGEGNGNPLQRSSLENPRDGEARWAAVSGVAQSRTRLKRLGSRAGFQRGLSSTYPLIPPMRTFSAGASHSARASSSRKPPRT